MRQALTVAVAQPPTAAYDVAANAAAHARAVRSAGARVVAFPELSLTGYELDALALAPDDPRLAPIAEACTATGTLALAGAPVEGDGGSEHIAMLAIDSAGARVAYRKAHLGGAEPERFTPGEGPATIEVGGWRLGLAICKDTGIARHAAETAALGADVLVAGVLETADDAGVVEERAQRTALAHEVWVAIASFAGSTGGGFDEAAGGSGIWNAAGVAVARAGAEPGEIASAPLD